VHALPLPFCALSSGAASRWLGQNSKQAKLARQLGELQIHMRLRVSGDRHEIRQQYVPALHPLLVQPLAENGAVRVLPALASCAARG
jgi:hypothetical protein